MRDPKTGNGAEGGELALELRGVAKAFGGLTAVNDVSLGVPAGERRAVIGPNGAGKTTLFNLISGELELTAGRVYLFGREISRMAPHSRVALGLGRTYQITNIFPRLTVEESVLLAAQGLSRAKYALLSGLPRDGDLHRKVVRTMEDLGLTEIRSVPAGELSHGEQRQLEIALALAGGPRLLLLDEPGAGLSAAERASIAALIRRLPRELTIVLIEHDMDLALGLVDRVTCLHYGRLIAEDEPEAIRRNERVQEVYLGAG